MSSREDAVRAVYAAARIDSQLAFYDARVSEYEKAREQAVTARGVLLLLAALCGVAGAVTPPDARAVLGIVAAVLAALAGAVTGFEALLGFEQLTKLYSDAATNLRLASVGWVGSTADLAEDVERVESVLEGEVAQWGQLRKEKPTTGA